MKTWNDPIRPVSFSKLSKVKATPGRAPGQNTSSKSLLPHFPMCCSSSEASLAFISGLSSWNLFNLNFKKEVILWAYFCGLIRDLHAANEKQGLALVKYAQLLTGYHQWHGFPHSLCYILEMSSSGLKMAAFLSLPFSAPLGFPLIDLSLTFWNHQRKCFLFVEERHNFSVSQKEKKKFPYMELVLIGLCALN